MRIKLIDRLIVQEFVSTFFFMLLLLILIIVAIDVSEKMDDFIDHKAPVKGIIFIYYLNFIPYIGNLLSPIVVFLSCIFFTSKLTQRSEIIAILSSGVSFYRLLAPYLVTALGLGAMSFYLNAYIVPHATRKYQEFEYEFIKGKQVFDRRNIHKKIAPNNYVYLYSYNQYDKYGTLFTLEERDKERLKSKLDAVDAKYVDSTHKWRLSSVRIRQFTGEKEKLITRPLLDTTLALAPEDIYQRENQSKSLTLTELNHYISRERERGSDFISQLLLDYQERYAYPVAAMVLTIMGVALSTKKRRGGIGLQLGIGFILCFIYVFILSTAKAILGDSAPIWVAIWTPNILFFVLSVLLIRLAPK